MKYRIGILDDEPLVRSSIQAKLKLTDLAYEVVLEHDDGHALLRRLREAKQQPVDVMFVDIVMPRMDGLEFIKHAKEIWPDIHYIIASGHNDFPYARSAIQLGVHDYLMKPIMTDELISTMDSMKYKVEKTTSSKQADYKNEMAIWLSQRGAGRLNEATEAYAREQVANRPHVYVVLVGNFYSAQAEIPDFEGKPGEFYFPMYVGGLHHVLVYFHASGHYATQIFDSCTHTSTVTIAHLSSVQAFERLPELVSFGLHKIRETLVLDERNLIHVKADEVIPDKFWTDVNVEHASLLEKIKLERRYEVAWELVRQLIHAKLPQKVKEQAFHLFMSNIFRMEVSTEWLQSFDRTEPFITACVDLVKMAHDEPWPTSGKDILREVLADMEKQYSLRKTLQDYADEYGIHPNHLARLFKKQLNSTFLEHMTQVRMKRARTLLLETKKTVAEIAMEVGYEDGRYFSQVFRRIYHTTPSAFRE
jgi:two-component system response regulator YesN